MIGLGLAQAEANLFATFESLAQGPMSHSEGKTVFTKESAASAEEAVARAATEAELSRTARADHTVLILKRNTLAERLQVIVMGEGRYGKVLYENAGGHVLRNML